MIITMQEYDGIGLAATSWKKERIFVIDLYYWIVVCITKALQDAEEESEKRGV